MKAKSQNHGPIQGKSRLGTIPSDELFHLKLVISPRMRRAEAVEYRGFRVIQIWELQDDLAAGWPSVPFAHMSGLRAAGTHKIDPPVELCLQECVGDLPLVESSSLSRRSNQ